MYIVYLEYTYSKVNSFHSSNENWLEISNKSEPLVCPEVILYQNPKNTEKSYFFFDFLFNLNLVKLTVTFIHNEM